MADALDHLIKIIGVVHGCLKQMKKRQNIVEYNDFKLCRKRLRPSRMRFIDYGESVFTDFWTCYQSVANEAE